MNNQALVAEEEAGGGGTSSKYFEIKTSAGTNGKIIPENPVVKKGETIELTFIANDGYEIDYVLVDGVSVGKQGSYTFTNVVTNHKIEAFFIAKLVNQPQSNSGETSIQQSNQIGNVSGGSNVQQINQVNNINNVIIIFNDINEYDWYINAIQFAVDNNLFYGMGQNNFSPNENMSRAMLVTVLHRFAGKPQASLVNSFTDVDNNSYYVDALNWALENNIIYGIDNQTFGTNQNITREQLATILYRYAKLTNLNIDIDEVLLDSYVDKTDIENYATDALAWAIKNGLIKGRTETSLSPKGTATRAEVATILERLSKII